MYFITLVADGIADPVTQDLIDPLISLYIHLTGSSLWTSDAAVMLSTDILALI